MRMRGKIRTFVRMRRQIRAYRNKSTTTCLTGCKPIKLI